MVESEQNELLNQELIKYQQMYCKKIATHFGDYPEEIAQFIFPAFFAPDVWEDAHKVYKKVVEQIAFLDGELPIMFVGGRSQNKITRKNQAIGFFLTDYTLYVLEPSVFSDTLPQKFAYNSSINEANQTVNEAINAFDWDFLEPILPENGKEVLSHFIWESIVDILTLKKDFNIEHVVMEKSTTLAGRIIDLGLMDDSCVKLGEDVKHQKHFKKIHKKFGIPDDESICFAVTDSTLAGVYGLVVTEENIYSKDLMEKTEKTELKELSSTYPSTVIESSIRLGDTIVHTLPKYTANKEAVKIILVELINGELKED
ncbi:hypothetical protein [Enterococcus sp. HY326]|uniref:hypothetical protein n=1 Tax=Enterococcus sp. HY326 TaxID=2971265 RepID=UPI00223F99F0|nr:hypothetical protein [Enterococcus sp. HY326]